jgi:ATP-dependent Lon protease
MSTTKLPLVILSYPRILLPTTGVSQSLSRSNLNSLKVLPQEDPDTRPHVFVVSALSPVKGSQESAPIASIGVIAEIKRVFKAPVDGGNLVPFVYLQGTGKRARLCDASSSSRKFLEPVEVEYFDEALIPSKDAIEAFRSAALASLRGLVADPGQGVRRGVWQAMQASAENVSEDYALALADSLVSLMKLEHSERLGMVHQPVYVAILILDPEYLGHASSDARLSHATKLLIKHNSITEVSQKIASDVNENLSRQQKEFYLRQQLAAIQRELGQLNHREGNRSPAPNANGDSVSELDDDAGRDNEELDDLKRKIEALAQDSEERKVCVREWKRMKRIQAGSVEQGIIRSYVCDIGSPHI